MGTASQSLLRGDANEKRALDDLLKRVNKPGFGKNKKVALDQIFREVINEAIFGESVDANTKRRVRQAVQGPVMDRIIRKYLDWQENGAKPSKWPFPKKPRQRAKNRSRGRIF